MNKFTKQDLGMLLSGSMGMLLSGSMYFVLNKYYYKPPVIVIRVRNSLRPCYPIGIKLWGHMILALYFQAVLIEACDKRFIPSGYLGEKFKGG